MLLSRQLPLLSRNGPLLLFASSSSSSSSFKHLSSSSSSSLKNVYSSSSSFSSKSLPSSSSSLKHLYYSSSSTSTSSSSSPSSSSSSSPDNFKIIYRFPHIKTARTICRLKLYQTFITCLAVPTATALAQAGTVAPSALPVTLAISAVALGMLGIMGEIFRRVIGLLYLSDDGKCLKVSHLSFFGGRIDTVLAVADVVPLSDSGENLLDAFVLVQTYPHSCLERSGGGLFDNFGVGRGVFLLCVRYGGVVDRGAFERVFGRCLE